MNKNAGRILSDSYRSYKEIRTPTELNGSRFKNTSLDSLANSSNNSESLSDDSDAESKSFAVKCEVYSRSSCGSIRSWNKSESGNSDSCYDYVGSECEKKATESAAGRMETIPEESSGEHKVSVKEILARFENLKENCRDYNNNSHNSHNSQNISNVNSQSNGNINGFGKDAVVISNGGNCSVIDKSVSSSVAVPVNVSVSVNGKVAGNSNSGNNIHQPGQVVVKKSSEICAASSVKIANNAKEVIA